MHKEYANTFVQFMDIVEKEEIIKVVMTVVIVNQVSTITFNYFTSPTILIMALKLVGLEFLILYRRIYLRW